MVNQNSRKKTIEQLARSMGVDVSEVSKAARQVLEIPSGHARDVRFQLTPYQCQQIRSKLGFPCSVDGVEVMEEGSHLAPTESVTQSKSLLPLRLDPPAHLDTLQFRDLNYGIWFHPEVADSLHEMESLRKRLSIVLQHLGAHGKTSVVKGCRDVDNRGWFRSPLGGNNGMQYYLWWSPQGSRQTKVIDLPEHDILVRAVRHHDNHEPIEVGIIDDYLYFGQHELEDEKLVGRPWTEDQLQFIDNEDPVRLLLGRPGSGKTTALWKAVEARSDQQVLYLTWSRELTRYADEHLHSFAPVDVKVDARDFATFLGEICGTDIKRQPMSQSQALFRQSISELSPKIMGPWAGRENALFAEIRAFLIGRAIPGDHNCESAKGIVRLKDEVYLKMRSGKKGIGKDASKALLRIFSVIEQDAPFPKIFPELTAAAKVVELLRMDKVSEGFMGFDRIVVDEVQDLTLLESSVVIELCCAIARRRKFAPWLLVAGDDGQTVRPSGFDWGPLKDLITRRIATPKDFHLEENLRCPDRIAGVIERASSRYANLEKRLRPTKQRHQPGGQHVDAQLLYVNTKTRQEAVDLLESVDDVKGAVVITPQEDIPRWLPEHVKDMVMTPAEAKGLEYQSVCVLNPGRLLARLESATSNPALADLAEHEYRTTIDQLRVALSRATETLVFVDVDADESERELSWTLLGDAAPFDPEDLAEHFTDVDAPVVEKVLACLNDSRALLEERPRRAWQRVYQAMRLLGNPNLPNGVSDEFVRRDTYKTLLATAACLLVDAVPSGVSRSEVVDASREALVKLDSPTDTEAFYQLERWTCEKTASPNALLDAALSLGREDDEWLRTAITPLAQTLRQGLISSATSSEAAKELAGDVEARLIFTGYVGDATSEARQLRCQAVDTLIEAGKLKSAELVLAKLKPEDDFRTGRLREAQRDFVTAAEAFERAGANEDALRNWRASAKWEKAVLLAEGTEKEDMEWLIKIESLLKRRPEGQRERLTKEELIRLEKLINPE